MAALAVIPSPEARRLFGRMVARADDDLHMGLEETLVLGADLVQYGESASVIVELEQAGWVEPHPDGGWSLYDAAPAVDVR